MKVKLSSSITRPNLVISRFKQIAMHKFAILFLLPILLLSCSKDPSPEDNPPVIPPVTDTMPAQYGTPFTHVVDREDVERDEDRLACGGGGAAQGIPRALRGIRHSRGKLRAACGGEGDGRNGGEGERDDPMIQQ